jgi:hypothetical protein
MLKYPSSSYPIIRYTYPDINTVTQNRKTRSGHDQKILVKYARTVNQRGYLLAFQRSSYLLYETYSATKKAWTREIRGNKNKCMKILIFVIKNRQAKSNEAKIMYIN